MFLYTYIVILSLSQNKIEILSLKRCLKMGRRRKKIVKLPKKKLPIIFLCPACGERSVNIQIARKTNTAMVRCGKCGIEKDVLISPIEQPIDAYCKFTDGFYASSMEHK
jgi:transcription elongation factor Elf1